MPKQPAYPVYLVTITAVSFLMSTAFTTSAIYRFEMAQLNPLQLVLVGTLLELSVFLFEIPTGVVADLYSRRLSVIIGYALIGLGLMLEGALPLFATILVAQFVWGLGYTFTSGAQDAWLADELGEDRLPAAMLRGAQLAQVGAFAGIGVGVWLASLRLNIPFLVGGGGLLLLALYLVLFMPESHFTRAPKGERTTWQDMAHTFQGGMGAIRGRPLLMVIMGISLVYGLYSEGLDRLWEAHLLDNFTLPAVGSLDPIYWFGLMNGAIMLITMGLTEFLRRRADRMDHRRAVLTLMVLDGVQVLGLILFGLAVSFPMAVAAYLVLATVRSAAAPVFSAWINRGLDPRTRATVLSTVGQMNAVGQVVGGPPMGALGVRWGLRAVMVGIGLLLAPVLALYGRALTLGTATPAAPENPPAENP